MSRGAPEYDAIVVGSGMTGGWAAKELTELGLRTLVLDAGRPIVPNKDYPRAHAAVGDAVPRAGRPADGRASSGGAAELGDVRRDEPPVLGGRRRQPVLDAREQGVSLVSRAAGRREVHHLGSPGLPLERPRLRGEPARWRWRRLAHSLRGHRALVRSRRAVHWCERADGGTRASARRAIPPADGDELRRVARARSDGLEVRAGPRADDGPSGSADRATQWSGRVSLLRPVPSRLRHALVLQQRERDAAGGGGDRTPDAHAVQYRAPVSCYDERTNRVSGVLVVDARTRETREYTARVVFLCASALESARILLNSATSRHPDGLANSSGQVGRNVMDHIKWGGASGTFDGWSDRQTIGQRPNGILRAPVPQRDHATPRLHSRLRLSGWRGARRVGGESQGAGHRARVQGAPNATRAVDDELRRLRRDVAAIPSNRATLHPTLVDAWGIPTLHIECGWSDNELAIHRDMNVTAAELLEAAGAKDIRPDARGPSTPGNTNHEMGTARMGRDPKTSVLNGWNQTWDVPNVFVTDGACMASSGNQNPSLTYMALTARACHYAVDAMKRGDL